MLQSSTSTCAISNYYSSKRKTLSSNPNLTSNNYIRRTNSFQNIHPPITETNNDLAFQDNPTNINNPNRTVIEQPYYQDNNILNNSIRNVSNTYTLGNCFRLSKSNTSSVQKIKDLEHELQKAKELIEILKHQNQSLLSQRDSTRNQLTNINDNETFQKEQLKQLEDELALSTSKNEITSTKLLQVSNEHTKMENDIQILNEMLFEKDKNVEQAQTELEYAKRHMNNTINSLQNELEKNKQSFTQQRQELQYSNKVLNDKVMQLQHDLADEKQRHDTLQKKQTNANDSMIDKNSQNVLKCLFDLFNNTRTILDINAKPLTLEDILEESNPEIFRQQVSILQEKIRCSNESSKLKFGKCLACDIACCSTHNDRIKFFQKKK